MTTEEHLQRIRARCVELLAIAEAAKITNVETMARRVSINIGDWAPVKTPEIALFIASCAGPAEAGWKATIAAINDIVVRKQFDGGAFPTCAVTSGILAAWPEELL